MEGNSSGIGPKLDADAAQRSVLEMREFLAAQLAK
jgi:hypothetical protein